MENSPDEHQLKNAQILEQKRAVIMIRQQNFSSEKLKITLNSVINTPEEALKTGNNIYNFKLGSTANLLAEQLLESLI